MIYEQVGKAEPLSPYKIFHKLITTTAVAPPLPMHLLNRNVAGGNYLEPFDGRPPGPDWSLRSQVAHKLHGHSLASKLLCHRRREFTFRSFISCLLDEQPLLASRIFTCVNFPCIIIPHT